mgnify:CR=1 FL=1
MLGLLIAVLAAVGCVSSWLAAGREVVVAPVLDGEPSTMSTPVSPPRMTLSSIHSWDPLL